MPSGCIKVKEIELLLGPLCHITMARRKKHGNASLHQTIQDKKKKHAHFSESALRLEVFSQSVSTYDMELFLLR